MPSAQMAAGFLLLAAIIGCDNQEASPPAMPASAVVGDVPPPPPPAVPVAAWPAPEAPLKVLPVAAPPGFGVRRVYLDVGHGAPRNPGNLSALCESEQDVMMTLAASVAPWLEATGLFSVRLSRQPGQTVAYKDRLADAQAWSAAAFVSLHSDSRGDYTEDAQGCRHNDTDPGFSVLFSDEGEPALVAAREGLARAIGRQLTAAGFLPYTGLNYLGLYEARGEGAYVDRHEPQKRIMFLRRPVMPSVIVETHHALDAQAARRWKEPATVEAFSAALAAGLVEWFVAQDSGG